MKKSFLLFLTAFLAVTFFFAGCKKTDSNPTTPPDTTTPKTTQPIPTFSGTVDGIVAAIQFSYTYAGYTVNMDMGFANFGDINGTGTDAGTVTLNGKTIAKTAQGTSVYYNSFASTPPTTVDLNWDGSTHSWSVSGAGTTPAFTLDVVSPSTFTVSNPTTSTVASKSNALNITWSGAFSTSSDSVMIVLVPLTGSGATFTATTTNKTGSYSIPASQLSGFSGDAMLEVVKYRYAMKTVSGKNFVGVAEIVNTVNFKIQ